MAEEAVMSNLPLLSQIFGAVVGPSPKTWLMLASLLFSIGLFGALTRRNAVGVMLAMELMLNAAALNFVIFNYFIAPRQVDGVVMAMFIIAVAAAEVVVGISIFIAIFRHYRTNDVNLISTMRN